MYGESRVDKLEIALSIALEEIKKLKDRLHKLETKDER